MGHTFRGEFSYSFCQPLRNENGRREVREGDGALAGQTCSTGEEQPQQKDTLVPPSNLFTASRLTLKAILQVNQIRQKEKNKNMLSIKCKTCAP